MHHQFTWHVLINDYTLYYMHNISLLLYISSYIHAALLLTYIDEAVSYCMPVTVEINDFISISLHIAILLLFGRCIEAVEELCMHRSIYLLHIGIELLQMS